MAQHLRIIASGWQEFTGHFGSIEFQSGVSVEPLTRNQIDHISALVMCDIVKDGESDGQQAGASARLVGGTSVGPIPTNGLRAATQEELDAERRRISANSGRAPTPIYTQAELETIAEKEGITGLRVIGDKWHVRDRAINKIIQAILRAQAAFVARTAEKKAEGDKRRLAATQEALEKQAERQAEIDARARVMTAVVESETSNAIGPNGENTHVSLKPLTNTDEDFGPVVTDAAPAPTLQTIEAEIQTMIAAETPPAEITPPVETPPEETETPPSE